MFYEWDWPAAEREFKRALELNPNYATAHVWYSNYLPVVGRLEEAIASARRAQELEPLSLMNGSLVGRNLYYARRYDEAIEQLRKVLDLDPNFARAHWFLGLALEQKGKYPEAIAELQRAFRLSDEPNFLGGLGHTYGVSGNREGAQKTLVQLLQLSKARYVDSFNLALVHISLGDKEQALQGLERACEERFFYVTWLKFDPRLDGIRTEPRYRDLLRRLKLEP